MISEHNSRRTDLPVAELFYHSTLVLFDGLPQGLERASGGFRLGQ